MTEDALNPYVEDVLDYIMKKCLWQFHSRAWDRERQNEGVMEKTRQILIGEEPLKELPEDRCHWVDAELMARGLREYYPWASTLTKAELSGVMEAAKLKLDRLTIHGSLNEELSDPKY
jgi:nitrogenase delta subunit